MRLNIAEPIVFIHVPKCAGSSIRSMLNTNFGGAVLKHYRDEPNDRNPQPIAFEDADAIVKRYGKCIIYGHFNMNRGFGVQNSIPWAKQFITILREPFSQFVSSFKYSQRNDPKEINEKSFSRFLENNEPNYLNHFPKKITRDNYTSVIEHDFKFIGFSSDILASYESLKSLLKIETDIAMPKVNVSPKPNLHFNQFRGEFYEKFSLEVDVYKYAREVWHGKKD